MSDSASLPVCLDDAAAVAARLRDLAALADAPMRSRQLMAQADRLTAIVRQIRYCTCCPSAEDEGMEAPF